MGKFGSGGWAKIDICLIDYDIGLPYLVYEKTLLYFDLDRIIMLIKKKIIKLKNQNIIDFSCS